MTSQKRHASSMLMAKLSQSTDIQAPPVPNIQPLASYLNPSQQMAGRGGMERDG